MTTTVAVRPQTPDIVRLSVTARGRTTDLVLPSRVPLTQLLPDVVGGVGALDAYDVHAGYALLADGGRRLDEGASLLAQGVGDGALLTLAPGVSVPDVRVYDDPAEAVADTVTGLGRAWDQRSAQVTRLVASYLVLGGGAVALAVLRSPGPQVAVAAGAVATSLLVGGVTLARVRADLAGATVVLLGSGAYGVVAALTTPAEFRSLAAGLVLVAVGVVTASVLVGRRWLAAPYVALGSVGALLGAAQLGTRIDTARLAAVAVGAVVALGAAGARLALAVAARDLDAVDHRGVDLTRVRRGVVTAQGAARSVDLGVGSVLLVAAPVVVRLGWSGVLVVWVAGLLVALRGRRHVAAADVAVGLGGGVLPVVTGTVWALATRPAPTALVLGGVALGVAAVALALGSPLPRDLRRSRLLDAVEGAALVALLPLLVVASGLVPGLGR